MFYKMSNAHADKNIYFVMLIIAELCLLSIFEEKLT